jgi:hypothetical protein
METKLLGTVNVDFEAVGQLLIIYFALVKFWRKNWNKMAQCISSLLVSRKLMIQLVGRSNIIFSLSMISP